MNARILIDFFTRLIKDAERNVLLILDNLRVHRARLVKTWLAEHEEEIEVFGLEGRRHPMSAGARSFQ